MEAVKIVQKEQKEEKEMRERKEKKLRLKLQIPLDIPIDYAKLLKEPITKYRLREWNSIFRFKKLKSLLKKCAEKMQKHIQKPVLEYPNYGNFMKRQFLTKYTK